MSGELQLTGDSAVFFCLSVGFLFFCLFCFVFVCVGVREGGEGGVGPFKIPRKHLRNEGDWVSGGRVDVGWNPLACGVCLVGIAGAHALEGRAYRNAEGHLEPRGLQQGCQLSCS